MYINQPFSFTFLSTINVYLNCIILFSQETQNFVAFTSTAKTYSKSCSILFKWCAFGFFLFLNTLKICVLISHCTVYRKKCKKKRWHERMTLQPKLQKLGTHFNKHRKTDLFFIIIKWLIFVFLLFRFCFNHVVHDRTVNIIFYITYYTSSLVYLSHVKKVSTLSGLKFYHSSLKGRRKKDQIHLIQ